MKIKIEHIEKNQDNEDVFVEDKEMAASKKSVADEFANAVKLNKADDFYVHYCRHDEGQPCTRIKLHESFKTNTKGKSR